MITLFRRRLVLAQSADMRSQELLDAGIELEWRRRVARNPIERARIQRERYPTAKELIHGKC